MAKNCAMSHISPALEAEVREALQALKAIMKKIDRVLYAKGNGAKTPMADLQRRVAALEQQQPGKSPKRKR